MISSVFGFTMSPWEIILRGSLIFWFLFLVFRVVLRRDVGSMGITDFLFVVLLGDAAQNGMIGDATSTSDATVLISTLVFWNVAIDWVTFRSPYLEKLLLNTKLLLVQDGRMLRRNMRREFITDEDILSKVRSEGLEDLTGVKRVYLEADGQLTVIKRRAQHA